MMYPHDIPIGGWFTPQYIICLIDSHSPGQLHLHRQGPSSEVQGAQPEANAGAVEASNFFGRLGLVVP